MPGNAESVDHPGVSVLLARSFDRDTLSMIRRAVLGSLPMDELEEARAHGFLAAINEGLINAIQHGGGRGNLLLARRDARLVAVVEDTRPAIPLVFPLAPPPPDAEGGRGLWIITRSCDAVRVESGSTGLRLVMELIVGPHGPGVATGLDGEKLEEPAYGEHVPDVRLRT
jgi:anti-sigma regulatory factor (Ser/Thr protein kinase)